MSEPSWTEAEIRAALKGHDSYASDDGDESCNVHCECDDWTGFDVEHVIDVLKASRAASFTLTADGLFPGTTSGTVTITPQLGAPDHDRT